MKIRDKVTVWMLALGGVAIGVAVWAYALGALTGTGAILVAGIPAIAMALAQCVWTILWTEPVAD